MKIFSLVISGTWPHNKMRRIVNSVGQKFVWVHRNPHQKNPHSPTILEGFDIFTLHYTTPSPFYTYSNYCLKRCAQPLIPLCKYTHTMLIADAANLKDYTYTMLALGCQHYHMAFGGVKIREYTQFPKPITTLPSKYSNPLFILGCLFLVLKNSQVTQWNGILFSHSYDIFYYKFNGQILLLL